MFTDFIVQPIFNLLVLIYALLPGHNFGLAIIIFTIIIRLLLWPLVKKQLHQAKLMKKIQPELKRIARETKGNRQQQSIMQMELYKERGINPFGSIGVALLQLPILIGLYAGLQRVIHDKHQMYDFAYPALQHLGWMQELKQNIHLFDATLFHVVDLGRAAIGPAGFYIPAFILVVASAVTQYYQAKQLMPNDKDGRKLRDIMRDAGKGKQADQQEVSAAVGRSTRFILPAMIFLFTINIASALGLYWFIGGLVAFIQQSIVLREDQEEMEELSGDARDSRRDTSKIPEAEVVAAAATATPTPTTKERASQKAQAAKSKQPGKPVKSQQQTPAAATRGIGGTTVTRITRSSDKRKK